MPSPVVDAAPTVVPDRITPEPAVRPIPSWQLPPGLTGVGRFDPSLLSTASGAGPVTLGQPPRPPGPVRVGGNIQPPARTVYVTPSYPLFARTARIEGDVVLDATIDEKGVVTNVTVRRSIPALDQAAIEAVSRWRYAPTRLNGVPVAVVMQVTVVFRMR
jgi:protein TonB